MVSLMLPALSYAMVYVFSSKRHQAIGSSDSTLAGVLVKNPITIANMDAVVFILALEFARSIPASPFSPWTLIWSDTRRNSVG